MISEELVASGGIQVREADVPERPPKATAAREPRVSVVPWSPQGLPWPFLPKETVRKGGMGSWKQAQEMASDA